ncbi:KpsF/GutQ family sugar-phosphate isomerase [Calycomorphotria hydatis]|uniref:Arabinose 5-phosphate isomerase KdsD n=1 Tax=Calycomorphotria hydatis TaxID=2528027 RepID=A0A517T6Y5_9PLAN|nr:KpsF/GutQ family sugar-phosphate isomerase [Calycomorphotria hydatis]QDT64120.1 Arabinose 5-phosphate isomerase KdsD [Calycomorphotria hydatis]
MAFAAEAVVPYDHFEQLREARDVLRAEADALKSVASTLDASFCKAVELIDQSSGSVIVTGVGKAGLIGQKITATFSSLGIRSHILHPVEAVHGDLGCIHEDDVVLALSNSGETEELNRLLPMFERFGVPVIAVTASDRSTLGMRSTVAIEIGKHQEVDAHNLAPTTSTTVMLAIGDALAVVLSRRRGFTPQNFALFHPAGSLGRKLSLVKDVMRTDHALRVCSPEETVREVLSQQARPGRRTGAIMVQDEAGVLRGLFTDSDLAKLLERRQEAHIDLPIREVMTLDPITIGPNERLSEAIEILSTRKLSELPVVDEKGHPLGLIDITDVISLMPDADDASTSH